MAPTPDKSPRKAPGEAPAETSSDRIVFRDSFLFYFAPDAREKLSSGSARCRRGARGLILSREPRDGHSDNRITPAAVAVGSRALPGSLFGALCFFVLVME